MLSLLSGMQLNYSLIHTLLQKKAAVRLQSLKRIHREEAPVRDIASMHAFPGIIDQSKSFKGGE